MIKKGDFVELDYTGRIKDDKIIFDTTEEEVARASDNFNPKFLYKPAIVCIGERQLIKGLDEALIGKIPSKFTVEIKAEDGFGKKSPSLLKLLPMKLFLKDKIQPFPGLEVNVDDQIGIVRSVSGGRVIVDFNHPLASKDLVYDVDVKRIVTDPVEQVRSMLEMIQLPFAAIDIEDDKAIIVLKAKLPEEMLNEMAEHIKKLTRLSAVTFSTAEPKEKRPEQKHEKKDAEQEGEHPAENA
jgi:FKBP-type peptidyl-prolyl cis-trans isomerase 2